MAYQCQRWYVWTADHQKHECVYDELAQAKAERDRALELLERARKWIPHEPSGSDGWNSNNSPCRVDCIACNAKEFLSAQRGGGNEA